MINYLVIIKDVQKRFKHLIDVKNYIVNESYKYGYNPLTQDIDYISEGLLKRNYCNVRCVSKHNKEHYELITIIQTK